MRYAEIDSAGNIVSVVEVFRSDDAPGEAPTLAEVAATGVVNGRTLAEIPDEIETFSPPEMRYEQGEFVPAPPVEAVDNTA